MRKIRQIKVKLPGISLLLILMFCPAVWANKVHLHGGNNLIHAEEDQYGEGNVSIKDLLGKALEKEKLGDFVSCIPYYDSAIKIAQSHKDELMINYLKRKKGATFLFSNQFDSARVYLVSVEEYAKQNSIDSLLADVQLNLGYLAGKEANEQVCLEYYHSALELYKKENDTIGIASVMNNYSLFYEAKGDYDKALENALLNSKLLSKYRNTRQYVGSLIALGNIYEKLKEYDTALAIYEESFKISNEYNYPAYANTSLINRAVIFYRQERYTESENELLKAIDYAKKINDNITLALLYSNIGIIYRNQGKIDQALQSYTQAMQISKDINDENRLASIYNNLGVLFKKEKNYTKAEEYYKLSLALAEKRQEKADIEKTYRNLASLYEEIGEYKRAYSCLTEANKWKDSVMSEEKVRAIEDMKAKYEKEKNLAQIRALQDENKIKELEKKSIRTERNSSIGISATVVFLLLLILFFFRMKARKNRIIDAQRIQKLEDEKKLLAAQSVIVGQENERKRIAQELHDGIGVLLSTASIHFSVVSKSAKDKKTIEMLDKAEQLLKQAGGEVRKISQNMMPVVLSKFGLFEALEDMFEKLEEIEDMEVKTSFTGSKERLPENSEIMLYRVIQEMVNNTLKHAKANNIEFAFSRGNGLILIDYKDDGVGFDFENLPRNSSLGVYGIQSRIDFLKGKLKVETGIGKGTYYHISFPVNNLKS